MAAGIFINYRREDTIATAGHLNDRLARSFGKKQIFMDVDHIPAGADFIHYIEDQLAHCGVLLAIIGTNWLSAHDGAGLRRLDDPNDLVANEITLALRRGINVIPVLVDGAIMPRPQDLPDALRPLTRRNAVELRNTQFGGDSDRLIGKIKGALRKEFISTKRWWIIFACIIAVILTWAMLSLAPISDWSRSLLGKTSAVENCDKTLGPSGSGLDFSGIFAGIIVDGTQSGAEVQLKLIRNGNAVRGSYLRAGICGSVSGEVAADRLVFNWDWAGSSGRGTATQVGDRLSGASGFRDQVQGGGTFVLFQRKPN